MPERRKHLRGRATVEIAVYDRGTKERVGRLVDMSTEGIMLVGGNPVSVNTVYEFKIIFPIAIYKDREIRFDAVCLWCHKQSGSPSFQAGFQLQNVSPELRKLLKCLIQGPGFEDTNHTPPR